MELETKKINRQQEAILENSANSATSKFNHVFMNTEACFLYPLNAYFNIFIPKAFQVDPKHKILKLFPELIVDDRYDYDNNEISDLEFTKLRKGANTKKRHSRVSQLNFTPNFSQNRA